MLKDYGRCFACGKANAQGLKLPVVEKADGVELDYVVPEEFAGWHGIVHGGIVATILDELLAYACNGANRTMLTAEMTVRYRRPVMIGQPVHGTARVTDDRGRLMLAEARLHDQAGQLLAEATGKLMQATRKQPGND
jgi:uncharacterized protein (TIGR00369 family)